MGAFYTYFSIYHDCRKPIFLQCWGCLSCCLFSCLVSCTLLYCAILWANKEVWWWCCPFSTCDPPTGSSNQHPEGNSFFFPFPLTSSPFLSLSRAPTAVVVVTEIQGHIAGSPPPSRYVRFVGYHSLSRENCSSFFLRRLASNLVPVQKLLKK